MYLTFYILADALNTYTYKLILKDTKESVPLYGVRFLLSSDNYNNDMLYFATAKMLENRIFDDISSPQNLMLVVPSMEKISDYKFKNIMFLCTDDAPLLIFSKIQEIFSNYERWHLRLSESIINSNDIDTLLDISAEMLNNPIALFDSGSTLVHWSGEFKTDTDHSIWRDVLDKGNTIDFYDYEEWKDLSVKMGRVNHPFIYHVRNETADAMLACPLTVDGKFVGGLGSTSINSPITIGQENIVLFIKSVVETSLRRNKSLRIIDENGVYFIEWMLNNIRVEDKIVFHYLKRRNWKTDDSYQLLNFHYPISNSDNLHSVSLPYISKIEKLLPGSLIYPHEGSVIAMVNTTVSPNVMDNFEQKIEKLYSRLRLQCSVSAQFYNFVDLRYYYIQSKIILSVGQRQDPEKAYYYFLDYYEGILANLINSVTSLKSFVHPEILHIWRMGDDTNNNLIQTLYTYLLNGRSISKTAAALFMHRNSLIYRLNKIFDILKLDMESIDSKTLSYLLISCIIVKYIEH